MLYQVVLIPILVDGSGRELEMEIRPFINSRMFLVNVVLNLTETPFVVCEMASSPSDRSVRSAQWLEYRAVMVRVHARMQLYSHR